VEAGWWITGEPYRYIADINLAFDFGSWKKTEFNIGGGVLTLIQDTDEDNFQPDRYRGTIELAAYHPKGPQAYIFSIRHQSFHTIDRPNPTDESYELYNVGWQRAGAPNLRFAVGYYAHRTDVDYQWDFLAQVDTVCLGYCKAGMFYGSATGHFVTEDGDIDRDNFFDYNLEAGIQTQAGTRFFLAKRLIHDIDQFNGLTQNGLILGVKYLW
jgi:hypothetical protein